LKCDYESTRVPSATWMDLDRDVYYMCNPWGFISVNISSLGQSISQWLMILRLFVLTQYQRVTDGQPDSLCTVPISRPVRRRVEFKIAPSWFSIEWSGTWLPGRGLSARRRRQRSPTSISRRSDLLHVPHVQHLRRPMLRSGWSMAMELLELAANQSKTASQSGTIQVFVKDIPV